MQGVKHAPIRRTTGSKTVPSHARNGYPVAAEGASHEMAEGGTETTETDNEGKTGEEKKREVRAGKDEGTTEEVRRWTLIRKGGNKKEKQERASGSKDGGANAKHEL